MADTFYGGISMNEAKDTSVRTPIDAAEAVTFTAAALQMLRYHEVVQARRLLVRALEFLGAP